MSSVNEWVVREFFEAHGFLVSQPRKYVVPGRAKWAEEEIDLMVHNPSVEKIILPDRMIWNPQDLSTVSKAVIGIRGWHTERFSVATFAQTPDILRFAEDSTFRFVEKRLGPGPVARILCLPRLPASGALKEQTLSVLKEKGVDGVISFQTILVDLVRQVDTNRNYEKSDVLQMLRLLKCYDLLKDSQMELFTRAAHRRRKSTS